MLCRMPVLTDQFGVLLALVAASLALNGLLIPAVGVAALACTINERAPVFAAVFAWEPWLMLGVLPYLAALWLIEPGALPAHVGYHEQTVGRLKRALDQPLTAVREYKKDLWLNMGGAVVMLAPWGAVLPLWLLGDVTWPSVAALVLGYGMCFVADGYARLYQWGAPALIAVAAPVAVGTGAWLPLLLVAHLWNPWCVIGNWDPKRGAR
jgi:hypothetical protein